MTPEEASQLKEKQRRLRDGLPESLNLRVHRAISWLTRASVESRDPDAAFIFYWIAFNSAYSQDIGIAHHVSEKGRFKSFLSTLLSLDSTDKIHELVWERYQCEIGLVCENQYVFGPFWNHLNGIETDVNWKDLFDQSMATVKQAFAAKDTEKVLNELFDRLSVLRNQIMYGGATWAGEINRAQVEDGADILGTLIPVFVDIMMENRDHRWSKPIYPVVDCNK